MKPYRRTDCADDTERQMISDESELIAGVKFTETQIAGEDFRLTVSDGEVKKIRSQHILQETWI